MRRCASACCAVGTSSIAWVGVTDGFWACFCCGPGLRSGSSGGFASPGGYDSDNGYLSSTPSPGTHHEVPDQSQRPLPLLSDTVDLVPALPDNAGTNSKSQANLAPVLSNDLLDTIAEADSETAPDIGLLVPDLAGILDGVETGDSSMQTDQLDLPPIDGLNELQLPSAVRTCNTLSLLIPRAIVYHPSPAHEGETYPICYAHNFAGPRTSRFESAIVH